MDLKKLTNFTIGFSSHFIEDAPIFAAIGAGARILEIHVTDDRSRTDMRDHALSRTPSELKNLIDNINALNQSLGSGQKAIQKSEYSAVVQLRKGLVYSKDLASGHFITENDLTYARPQNLKVRDMVQVVGRVLVKPVLAFTSVAPEDLGG
jgi:sialic acid synthase SpsE